MGNSDPRIIGFTGTHPRREGLSVSARVVNPTVGTWTVSVGLRLDDTQGEMTRILSLVMPNGQLGKAMRDDGTGTG